MPQVEEAGNLICSEWALHPPGFTLFPYTTLFRSGRCTGCGAPPRCIAPCASSGRSIRLRTSTTRDRKSTRLNSSHITISYAVFCLKKKRSLKSEMPQVEEAGNPHCSESALETEAL